MSIAKIRRHSPAFARIKVRTRASSFMWRSYILPAPNTPTQTWMNTRDIMYWLETKLLCTHSQPLKRPLRPGDHPSPERK